MNGRGDEQESGSRAERSEDARESGFEERMRELLAEDAHTIRPSPVPYTAIRQRGRNERRRRAAVAGAVLASLIAAPAGAYALAGGFGERGAQPAARQPSDGAPQTSAATASGPARPATDGQLLDKITFAQASDGLEKCLTAERGAPSARDNALGEAEDYRIILAAKSTGGSLPGDSFHVVGVRERPAGMRVVCDIEDGEAAGFSTGTSEADPPDAGPVVPDANSVGLFQQSAAGKGSWKLPFRWGVVGTVEPSVAEVYVSYGGANRRAVLDHGWFVASGLLGRQVTQAPRIKGYDSAGKLLYDSDQDKYWARTLS
ncbi:hypothetical protein ACFV0T_37485 [Streptomyces sp. NPDC059582]|uniref:hypothetical protein n=1 Tax=Streptomyces sp. NPDC059582 TaxID=3346875 RepID=UPI0036B93676